MKKLITAILFTLPLFGHFGVIVSSSDYVEEQKPKTIEYYFMHPFEQTYMKLDKPSVGVYYGDKKEDLTDKLIKTKNGYKVDYTFKSVDDYIFYMNPTPYYEKSEQKYIQHITKMCIDAYEAGSGWDKQVGLKAEIVPLTKPYSMQKGDIFRAIVYKDGKIAKNVEVEVELYNTKNIKAPTPNHITKVVKTDNNGIFSFVVNQSGWWGFSALLDGGKYKNKDLELGAVYWLLAH
jgi:cobalt/nickel transport protein